MLLTKTDPLPSDWSTPPDDTREEASATQLSARLARMEVADVEPAWLPYLAAAAAELASVAGITWRFSTDDPAVALLRLIAKATIACPDATGPHTRRLLAQLP